MSGMRTVLGLLIAIAATLAAHVALDGRSDSAPGLRRNTLVPSAERATELRLESRDRPVTCLVRDGDWKIVAPYAASADQSAVMRLTDKLSFASITDEMTDAELLRLGRTREDFGLDAPRLCLTVGGAGSSAVSVAFGNATPAGDGVYAAVNDKPTVYVVPTDVFSAADCPASALRRRRVLEVDPADIVSFDVKNGSGRFFRLAREGESWKIAEPYEGMASGSRVRSFLDALGGLEAQDFIWPVGGSNETSVASVSLLAGYGLDPESSVALTLKGLDGRARIVVFGRDAREGTVYALVQGGTAIVTVPSALRDTAAEGVMALADTRLFPFDAAAIGAISLDDGGTRHLLARGSDGAWRLDAPVSAAADSAAVDALLARLLALHSSDVVTDGVRVSVGTNAEPVCVVREALFADSRPEDLRAKEIVRIDPKLVKRVVVTDGDRKPVSIMMDAERNLWVVEEEESGRSVDASAVAALLAALDPLRAVRVVRLKVTASELGEYGLDTPLRTIAVDQTVEGALRRNVLIGDLADGGRYATLGSADAVFVISSESAGRLLSPAVR